MKEWRLISNDVKQVQDIEISCWYGDFKGAVEAELHDFSDASVLGYGCCISGIVTIIIATTNPLFFRNLELHQLKHKLFPG